jgi:hypothetical protein
MGGLSGSSGNGGTVQRGGAQRRSTQLSERALDRARARGRRTGENPTRPA